MRSLNAFNDMMRRRRWAEIIPLLAVTMSQDRFDDVSRVTQLVRLSDHNRPNELGQEWLGAIGQWGLAPLGVIRNGALDVVVNNKKAILNGKRMTDLLRVGLNQVGTFDPSMWTAEMYTLFKGGGSGDEQAWLSLVLEEPKQITEESLTLRFSGKELFLSTIDGQSPLPATIISLQSVGHAGAGAGVTGVQFSVTPAGGFRYLVVSILLDNVAGCTVTSVTSGGTACTRLRQIDSGNTHMELWALVAPNAGAQTVSVGFNEPVPSAHKVIAGMAFANVDQLNPIRQLTSQTGGDANPRSKPTADRGDLVFDFAGYYFDAGSLPNMTVGAGQTQQVNRTDVGNPGGTGDFVRLGASTEVGDWGAVDMDWNIAGGLNRFWGSIAGALRPAA